MHGPSAPRSNPSVIVVGAGFGGVAAAIELQQHGFTDVTVLDAADALGGTWFHNTYPGAACDVPSHLYSYSFAQRRDWSRVCSPQSEILQYVADVAQEHGIADRTVTGARVTDASWDDATATWTLSCEDGRSFTADAVVLATGQLHQPGYPRIEGRDDFAGESFHSAQWRHDIPLAGKRVAVVGTGASAVQFVPEIAEVAGHVDVFQRSGNWFLPRVNRPYPKAVRWAIEHVPGLQSYRRRFIYWFGESLTAAIRHPGTLGKAYRLVSTLHMRRQLKDPEVRAKVWPDYTWGCKRVLFSSKWLPALQRPNVEVVSDAITGIAAEGVVTGDGQLHPADVIIWGTGFRTQDFMFPMEVHGAGGRSLREEWGGSPHAHLGMLVPGFPNLFVMYGPNTNTSGGSIITYLEAQASYIRQAIALTRDKGAAAVEVLPEVEAASDKRLQAGFAGTAWTRCDSWYRTKDGRVVTNWPGYMHEYEAATRTVDPAQLTFVPAPERVA